MPGTYKIDIEPDALQTLKERGYVQVQVRQTCHRSKPFQKGHDYTHNNSDRGSLDDSMPITVSCDCCKKNSVGDRGTVQYVEIYFHKSSGDPYKSGRFDAPTSGQSCPDQEIVIDAEFVRNT